MKRKNNLFKKNNRGFTLAEVIIVLGIVGILVEMTVPALYYSVQKKIYTEQVKKSYSDIQTGFTTYMVTQNCSTLACLDIFNGYTYDAPWQTRFDATLSKIYKKNNDYGFRTLESANYSIRNLDGTDSGLSLWWVYAFKKINGVAIGFYDNDGGNCTQFAASNSRLKNSCMDVYIDVNAEKLPNAFGRDVFHFILGNDGFLYPVYGREHSKTGETNWRNDTSLCGTAGSTALPSTISGQGCAARIIEEGWQMNY